MPQEGRSSSMAIGVPVEAAPAKRPQPATLAGRWVTLCPLHAATQAESLYRKTRGPENDSLWLYLPEGPFATRESFDIAFRQKAASTDSVFLAICQSGSEVPLGWASYLRMEPVHRCIEVGSILYTKALQRTPGATEAMYLMARHAFEDLGYRRYEWKCNALNQPSRRAALRLGFRFEGIFRQHMIVKGRNRDTAWFAMLDSEWPQRKAALEQWLDPSNFDADGIQKLSLSKLNSSVHNCQQDPEAVQP